MKRHLALILALALSLPVTSIFAEGGAPTTVGTQQSDPIVVITHEAQTGIWVREKGENASTNASGSSSSGSWTAGWANAVGYNATIARHEFGRTTKIAGSGNYEAEVHSTLIDGPNYGGVQKFSKFTHACAQANQPNGTAQTCTSPNFPSSTGHKWLIITGHQFDIGDNGTWDLQCSGCIDWVFTHP